MASRWMQPKLAKMARDRKASSVPGSHRLGHTVEAANRLALELGATVQRFQGVVTVGDTGKPLQAIGKQRRALDRACYGNGARTDVRSSGLVLRTWDTFAREESTLIRKS